MSYGVNFPCSCLEIVFAYKVVKLLVTKEKENGRGSTLQSIYSCDGTKRRETHTLSCVCHVLLESSIL